MLYWYPYRRTEHEQYHDLRHRTCGGRVASGGNFYGWECKRCKTKWGMSRIYGFSDTQMLDRFEGAKPATDSGARLVWIEHEGRRYSTVAPPLMLRPGGKLGLGIQGTWEPWAP